MSEIDNTKGFLKYLLENCLFAYSELCKVNKALVEGMSLASGADVNHLGAMNRMIQDYLIIRVAGLFDEDKQNRGVASFGKLFSDNDDFKKIKSEKVIKYIINQRHNFVAHNNQDHTENNFPITAEICDTNLKELLERLERLL